MYRKHIFIALLALLPCGFGGCHLYVDEDSDPKNDGSEMTRFCDDWGCYECDEVKCIRVNGAPGRTSLLPGGQCDNSYQCAAGCYCDSNEICVEAGFCTTAADCPLDYECDDRSSCVPANRASLSCTDDLSCPTGTLCESGACLPTEICAASNNCSAGSGCDQERHTCVPGAQTTCQGVVECATAAPICPSGTTPAIADGCYTGACMAKADCPDGAVFECTDLDEDESACTNNASCGPVYRGENCTSPDGSICTENSGGPNPCTCESFIFDSCEAAS